MPTYAIPSFIEYKEHLTAASDRKHPWIRAGNSHAQLFTSWRIVEGQNVLDEVNLFYRENLRQKWLYCFFSRLRNNKDWGWTRLMDQTFLHANSELGKSEDDIREACRSVNLHEDVAKVPK